MNAAHSHQDIRDMLLDAAGLSIDRMPMLHVVFDRLGTLCAEGLRQLAASQAFYSLSSIETGRIGDALEMYEGMAVAGIYHVPMWDSHIIVGFDRDFVFTMIEALFGADGSEPPVEDERGFSNIELRIAQAIFEQMQKALHSAFAMVSDTQFKFERQETRMDFAVIGRRNNLAVTAKFLLQALNRGGEMFVIIPQSALTPMRQALSRTTPQETSGRDPIWTKQIRDEVNRTQVQVRAILEERHYPLGEIADFKVGQVLRLQASPRSMVKLESADQPLFWCHLGQAEGSYVLRVEDQINQNQEFLDDILPR
ncbi:flagellar motor switch protein FliM [Azorhizobium oxalatiphilum]|uniref:Flagellar motor switch protein FliM n=1 Tax=Azorhizobium oxalatiphilum TaxID=980631 RepID=A0A917BKN0_9HYPH|nr:FliM/FliN family flagellar motor switch protein [Azorhizobium oxalatiphilum]GGF47860.1 flagellar motor switch protein FliM [Azorhizobium oxalatiphilum]